ncbi:MAG: leucyl aminopeptidase, partial [Novosphingobium sp.]|nr:leucyl aminopeptidase [Novosphingobium sp.]
MKVEFVSAPLPVTTSPVAHVVNQDSLDATLDPVLAEGAKASRFTGKSGQLHEGFVSRDGTVVRVALAGAGEKGAKDRIASLERAGAAITAKYIASGESAVTIDLSDAGLGAAEAAAVILGARLRGWRHDVYRTKLPADQQASLTTIRVAGAPEGAEAAWNVEKALADGVELTRELVTEPANIIYPESFVERVRPRVEAAGIKVRVLEEAEMTKLGMGALLGVAQGSVRPPRLLVMEWNGGEPGAKPTAFVGKGVTFDTGGISIKPAAGMEDMKWDMGGAGAVAGAMLAIARRKAKANIVAVCGLVENMPDGNAQRPGDVVTSMSGQTVEVINTDAEGRLVLCDAITWVQKEYAPTAVIDLATLTGAMIISLGHEQGGIFSNDDGLADKLVAAGNVSGDKLWRMPLGPAYDKLIDSPIADMKNVGPR